MKTTTSRDGTVIAYEELGSGPAIVLVDGAFCGRGFGPMAALAALLAKYFTVFHYDRRGRGDSGDTAPYAVEREVEDLAAVFAAASARTGKAHLYGISSGAALAIRGAAGGLPIEQLVVYEPPFMLDGQRPDPEDFREQIIALLAAERRDDAVKLFMKVVGVPAFGIFFMRLLPNVWPKLRAIAHTLPYDFAVLGDTQRGLPMLKEMAEVLARVSVPTAALAGGKSPPWLHHAAQSVAKAVRDGSFCVVPGQDHNVAAKVIARVLVERCLKGTRA